MLLKILLLLVRCREKESSTTPYTVRNAESISLCNQSCEKDFLCVSHNMYVALPSWTADVWAPCTQYTHWRALKRAGLCSRMTPPSPNHYSREMCSCPRSLWYVVVLVLTICRTKIRRRRETHTLARNNSCPTTKPLHFEKKSHNCCGEKV